MKRAAFVLLVACSKKAPPPAVVVEAAAPPPVTAPALPASSVPTPTPTCDLAMETKTADLFVVNGWRAAYGKAAGFEEDKPPAEADAKSTLCRMDACAEAPPWIVKPKVTPHPDPTNIIAPLSGNRLAVLRVGVTGADLCAGKKDPMNRFVSEPSMKDEIIVYDEELTPLRAAEDGCEQAGPPRHVWHVVDVRSKKELVLRGTDLTVKPIARSVKIESKGCSETRSLD